MSLQKLLGELTKQTSDSALFEPNAFIDYLRSPAVTSLSDPFERLVGSALRAGSQANAGIAGHQAAVRRLFPETPASAITSFCVSEKRGPHPRYIDTQLHKVGDQWQISGEKMWGTMAPPATVIYVAASTGVVDGKNRLKMVAIDGDAKGITKIPLPPERQAGKVPICDLRFDNTPVRDNGIRDQDAYEGYIKPFRLIEDVFSTAAMQVALLRLGVGGVLSHETREDLVGQVVQAHAIAQSAMANPGDLLLITSYLRSSQAILQGLAGEFNPGGDIVRESWDLSRPILTVAARAREQRRQNAWAALGDPVSAPENSSNN